MSKSEGNHIVGRVSISALIGAVFLMGISAIGPGFLTQTASFTEQMGVNFAFVILVSIVLDIGAQLNIWRVIIVSNMRGQDIANAVIPGLGYLVAFFVILGGLAFNIGNIAGAGLGIEVIAGIDVKVGAVISALIAISIFLIKDAQLIMNKFVQYLGIIMILLTVYVVFHTKPPLAEAALRSVYPTQIDIFAIVTLVGGTVGGYITFAGAHRLLDSDIHGPEAIKVTTRGAVSGIFVTAIMRVILFLAVLGIVTQGFKLSADNPVASVFEHAVGGIGYKIFGVVMWVAAITSVIGAAYTSVTFMQTFHPKIAKYKNEVIIAFICLSTIIFVGIGKPVQILILVGALNGLILPLTLGPMLFAAYKPTIVGTYKHPLWMTVFGAIVVILMAVFGVYTIIQMF